MKRGLLFWGFLFSFQLLQGQGINPVEQASAFLNKQTDLIDLAKSLFKIDEKSDSAFAKRKVYISLLPAASGVPGGGAALITSMNFSFYMGDRENTNLSTIWFTPYTNFAGQFVIPFKSNIWTANNQLNLVGDLRYMKYPQYTWGLGGNSPESDKTLIDYQYIRFYQNILRKIFTGFNVGVGLNIDYHYDIKVESDSLPDRIRIPSSSTSSGFTANFLFDTRQNSTNPVRGVYALAALRFNTLSIASDRAWQSLYLDFRKYINFSKTKKNQLAFWGYYWKILGGTPPYLDYPSNGWDPVSQRSARGIRQNRFRSDGLIYLESEYRLSFSENDFIGGVAFVNATLPEDYRGSEYNYVHVAGGVGLRIKFNKFSGTNVTLDYAISKQSPRGIIYLNLGETF